MVAFFQIALVTFTILLITFTVTIWVVLFIRVQKRHMDATIRCPQSFIPLALIFCQFDRINVMLPRLVFIKRFFPLLAHCSLDLQHCVVRTLIWVGLVVVVVVIVVVAVLRVRNFKLFFNPVKKTTMLLGRSDLLTICVGFFAGK